MFWNFWLCFLIRCVWRFFLLSTFKCFLNCFWMTYFNQHFHGLPKSFNNNSQCLRFLNFLFDFLPLYPYLWFGNLILNEIISLPNHKMYYHSHWISAMLCFLHQKQMCGTVEIWFGSKQLYANSDDPIKLCKPLQSCFSIFF